ncbi:MAG: DUF1294 domain-containing protein [Bacteroidales bacterium]|nr:DUF1294 domain-containing protein [Bacteroidales bacterium]
MVSFTQKRRIPMTKILIYYFIAVNILTFIAFGIDKIKACRNGSSHGKSHQSRRIPEASLLLLAALGGSPAALIAMPLFHHKTLHKKFRFGVPLILIAQIALLVILFLNK